MTNELQGLTSLQMGQRLRPVRVIQIEHGGLGNGVGGAQARGMFGVPFNFGRTPHVALDQYGLRHTAQGNGAREKERTAGDEFLRLPDVRNDRFRRLFDTRAHAGQRQRRAHQFEEIPAAFRIVPLGGLFRKLPVQVFAELRRISQLAEAPPIKAAVGVGQT